MASIGTLRPATATERIASIDIVRGAVMVLMAIDHVRVFSGLPGGGPSPGIFFTRWVTHFCAPAFVFLAGTSAFIYGRRHADLSRFLFIRGVWLIVLEFTLIRFSWTFNVDYAHYMLAGVIWMIGWSMIVLSLLSRLPVGVVAAIGVIIIAGHNVLDFVLPSLLPSLSAGAFAWLWKLLYLGFYVDPIRIGGSGPPLIVLYTLIPWIGVMAAGYGFGTIATAERDRRRRLCFAIGLSAIALFVILRGFDFYGDPRPWTQAAGRGQRMPAALAFLNTTKYPASLSFLLMTLGPAIALMPLVEDATGRIARWLTVFGRVPFFFYLLHIPLIHVLALIVSMARLGHVDPWLFANHPMGNPPAPPGSTWSLGLLYLVWAIATVLLYFACRWYLRVKTGKTAWWLRYV